MNAVNGNRYDYRYQSTGYRHHLSDPDDLLLLRLRANLLHINIHCKHGTQSIQCRSDSTDKRGSQHSQHQPHHPDRKQMGYHRHIRLIGILQLRKQGQTDDTRKNIKRNIQYFEPSGKVRSQLSFFQTFGCQHRLYHRLIRTPEPYSHHRISQNNRQPRESGIIIRSEQIPEVCRNGICQSRYTTNFIDSYNSQRSRNKNQQDHLINIRVGNRFQSSEHRKECGYDQQYQSGLPHRHIEYLTNQNATRKQCQCQPGNQDCNNRIPCQDITGRLSKPLSHKLRQGGNTRTQVTGSENKSKQAYKNEGIPGIIARNDAGSKSGTGRSYQHRRPHISPPHGESDMVPSQRMFRQKETAPLLSFGTCPYTNGDKNQKIGNQNAPIQCV